MVYMKCTDTADKISQIIDKEASLLTRLRFHGHIWMCPNCRRYFKQFKLIRQTASEITPHDLPDDFDNVMNAVMNKIENGKHKKNAR